MTTAELSLYEKYLNKYTYNQYTCRRYVYSSIRIFYINTNNTVHNALSIVQNNAYYSICPKVHIYTIFCLINIT